MTAPQWMTVWLGPAEVRNYGRGAAEDLVLYPTPGVRLVWRFASGAWVREVSVVHHDGLGSVRAVTSPSGLRVETTSYRPFGEPSKTPQSLGTAEMHAFIGKRFDEGAGLEYLSPRIDSSTGRLMALCRISRPLEQGRGQIARARGACGNR